MKKWLYIIVAIGVLGGLLVTAPFLLFTFSATDSAKTEAQVIEIKKGTPRDKVAAMLEEAGVVSSASRLLLLGKITGSWGNLKAGEYQVSPSMTPLKILDVVTSGVSVGYRITIPEGDNMYLIAERLESRGFGSKNEFLKLCRSKSFMRELGFEDPLPPTLEGYLFPETYFLSKTMTPKEILSKFHRRFLKVWNSSDFARRAADMGFTRHQLITLASVVEKETGDPAERGKISSVFHNRLKKRMRLASDPTTIYGVWYRYDGNIRRRDLQDKNDYNTYMLKGLPIGPISNPGVNAIEVTLDPDETEFLFFVSKNDGTSYFSKTYAEHNRAVQRYQVNAKARKGKSWRNLKTKKQ